MPDCVELQEMICESCMNKTPFLWNYAAHIAGNVRLVSASILHLQIFSMNAKFVCFFLKGENLNVHYLPKIFFY